MSLKTSNPTNLGKQAPSFTLLNVVDNKVYSLPELAGKNGTVICFICNHCPYVKAIIDNLSSDAFALKDEGIATIAIMPNDYLNYQDDRPEKMIEFAKKHNFNFPYLLDETQDVARSYGAACTPDFFGYNKNLKLCYHGCIDDTIVGKKEGSKRELLQAMQLIAKTGNGPKEQFASMGCSIKWKN